MSQIEKTRRQIVKKRGFVGGCCFCLCFGGFFVKCQKGQEKKKEKNEIFI